MFSVRIELKGINQQADVGFLTVMEQMRYCEVGSFYKNPKHAVWVMASETHLSGTSCGHYDAQSRLIHVYFAVLFSTEKLLASLETPGDVGRRIFKSFDPESNNFISTTSLQEVLAALNLVSEPE